MLSIFSCVFWPSVCPLWRNVCLDLLPIFWLGCLFFDVELHELFVYFGSLSLVSHLVCKHFLSFCGLSFHFAYGFLFCAKALKFNYIPFICFYFHCSRRWIQKDIASIYVRVFCLCSLLGVLWCHVLCLSLKAFLSLFLCMVRESVLTSLIYM